jgi:hypothetical protein
MGGSRLNAKTVANVSMTGVSRENAIKSLRRYRTERSRMYRINATMAWLMKAIATLETNARHPGKSKVARMTRTGIPKTCASITA